MNCIEFHLCIFHNLHTGPEVTLQSDNNRKYKFITEKYKGTREGGDTQVGIWDIRGKKRWDMGDWG